MRRRLSYHHSCAPCHRVCFHVTLSLWLKLEPHSLQHCVTRHRDETVAHSVWSTKERGTMANQWPSGLSRVSTIHAGTLHQRLLPRLRWLPPPPRHPQFPRTGIRLPPDKNPSCPRLLTTGSLPSRSTPLGSAHPPLLHHIFSTKNGPFTLFVGRWVGIGVYTSKQPIKHLGKT